MSEEVTVNSSSRYRLPSNSTMQHAAKFAVTNDKPILPINGLFFDKK